MRGKLRCHTHPKMYHCFKHLTNTGGRHWIQVGVVRSYPVLPSTCEIPVSTSIARRTLSRRNAMFPTFQRKYWIIESMMYVLLLWHRLLLGYVTIKSIWCSNLQPLNGVVYRNGRLESRMEATIARIEARLEGLWTLFCSSRWSYHRG